MTMISVTEALFRIKASASPLASKEIKLSLAFGAILARDIASPIDSPPFAQSAMDGYAVNATDVNGTRGVAIQGIIAAGDTRQHRLENGKAFRIFTGAPIPEGADTVIIQEYVRVKSDFIFWEKSALKQGANIRGRASQIAKGDLATNRGTKLTPGTIGFLAGLGVTDVLVYNQPKIGILVTGDELMPPGTPLSFGQIYESNGIALQAALAEGGLCPTALKHVRDSAHETSETLRGLLETNDIVLISGGISVGDFDFVHQALANNGVQTSFYKVAQKPGKPLYFGTKGKTLVFGLPGNPASVLTCFYVYVVPAICQMRGQTSQAKNVTELPLVQSVRKKEGLTQFMKAKVVNGAVDLLTGQESYKMQAFTDADCFAILPENKSELHAGEKVEVLDLTKVWSW